MKRLRSFLFSISCAFQNVKILDRLTTSQIMADNSLSIARFGDGEFNLISGKSIAFQRYDPELSQKLSQILKCKDKAIMVCVPSTLQNTDILNDDAKAFWKEWLFEQRRKVMRLMDKSKIYGDSLITRLYVPWRDKSNEEAIVENIKRIWNNKNIVVVEGEKTRCGVGNDLFSNAKSVSRIICPRENAWTKHDKILSACLKQSEKSIFYLALGPTATVLAYDLASNGRHAIDLGHMDLQYEFMLRKVEKRIAIKGKDNSELHYSDTSEVPLDSYLKSIVEKIV